MTEIDAFPALLFILLSHFTAVDQINEKVEKSLQNSSSQKEKSISFKTKPLSPIKSNELGEKLYTNDVIGEMDFMKNRPSTEG